MSYTMSDKIGKQANSLKDGRSKSRSIVVGLLVFFSVIAAYFLQQTWWTLFFAVELVLVIGIVELLARNLPKRLRRQIKINSRRSDGSKSAKRTEIEQGSIRRFKRSMIACFAFTLIPMHACWLTYCFFLPQIIRFSETVELRSKDEWLAIFLLPIFHVLVLVVIFMALSYNSLKNIYFESLRTLDDEVCRRAENYAVYDLIHPPGEQQEASKSA